MLFLPCDTAPLAGEYLVYCANGLLIGSMFLPDGGVLPPVAGSFDYFEIPENK